MSSAAIYATMSSLERAARREWLANASRVHFGACGPCGSTNDEHGKPLLVARQPRRREFECLTCWDARQ